MTRRDILARLTATTARPAAPGRPPRAAWDDGVRIENAADTATVYIYDEIGGWGVWASELVPELVALNVATIEVHLNSPGGDYFDGVAIANALADHPAKVVVHVDGLAASAASVVAMAGDEVVMHPGSQMMIHDALTVTVGNAGEHERTRALLDKVSADIAQLYASRAGVGDAQTWRAQMLAETWYTADEAVTARLADRAATRQPAEQPQVAASGWRELLAAYRAASCPASTEVLTSVASSETDAPQIPAPVAVAVQPDDEPPAAPALPMFDAELIRSAVREATA